VKKQTTVVQSSLKVVENVSCPKMRHNAQYKGRVFKNFNDYLIVKRSFQIQSLFMVPADPTHVRCVIAALLLLLNCLLP